MTTIEITALQKYKDEVRRRINNLRKSDLIMGEAKPFDLCNWFDAALEASFTFLTLRGGEYDNSRESMSVADSQGKVEQEPVRPMQAKRPIRMPCP
jgi:hypothetical protein